MGRCRFDYRCDDRRINGSIERVRFAIVTIRRTYETNSKKGISVTVKLAPINYIRFVTPNEAPGNVPASTTVVITPATTSAGIAA